MRFGLHRGRLHQRPRVFLQFPHTVLDIGPVEVGQGLLQVAGNAVVVHHQAVGLLGFHAVPPVGEAAVDPGDGLEQAVVPQRLVQVERLLHRGVEAGQEHVHHHQDFRLAIGVNEGVDYRFLVQLPGRLKFRAVVGNGGDDGVGVQPEIPQLAEVTHRGGAAGGHHLGLEPIGAHPFLEVLGDVQGNHLNAPLRLGHRLLVGVPAAYLLPHLFRLVAEHGVKQAVQGLRAFNSQFGQPGLVEDGHRGTVFHRLGMV